MAGVAVEEPVRLARPGVDVAVRTTDDERVPLEDADGGAIHHAGIVVSGRDLRIGSTSQLLREVCKVVEKGDAVGHSRDVGAGRLPVTRNDLGILGFPHPVSDVADAYDPGGRPD
jgi:hypothetical protein